MQRRGADLTKPSTYCQQRNRFPNASSIAGCQPSTYWWGNRFQQQEPDLIASSSRTIDDGKRIGKQTGDAVDNDNSARSLRYVEKFSGYWVFVCLSVLFVCCLPVKYDLSTPTSTIICVQVHILHQFGSHIAISPCFIMILIFFLLNSAHFILCSKVSKFSYAP